MSEPRRQSLDMDGLLAKWDSLGDKKLPKAPTVRFKSLGLTRKNRTPEEVILHTENMTVNKIKVKEDRRVLAPIPPIKEDSTPPVEGSVKPSKICPYCDRKLPQNPSPMLLGLYAKAAPQSQSTPTEENPEGLTPEARVVLIMEDLQIGREEAIKTMYASSSYGIHMFPDESSEEGDEMTA
ncbi:hypothetical protein C8R44DRAFT_857949 [Mycena epipterygia]|nr:hypothetical protein C8R44DRAFT_857949 [Mycena epipterygia]